MNDHPETRRVFNSGEQDGALLSVAFMEFKQFFKRIVAYNIAIKDEKDTILVALLKLLFS